jgi:hypothetical protein
MWWPWICSSQKFLQVRGLDFFPSGVCSQLFEDLPRLVITEYEGRRVTQYFNLNFVRRVSWNTMEIYYLFIIIFMCFTPRIISHRITKEFLKYFMYRRPILCTLHGAVDFFKFLKIAVVGGWGVLLGHSAYIISL